MKLTVILGVSVHPIGMACSILVLLSIITLTCINKKLANRMTVRLIASIALADLLSHIGEFYSALNGRLELGSLQCSVVNGFRLFSRTFYCFTNIAICFHLYRGLVLLKKSTWRYEIYAWIFTFVMVVIFTTVYWALGAFSGVSRKVGCNPGADNKIANSFFFFISGAVNVITIVIGIVTTVIGHRSLANWIDTYASSRSYQGEDQAQFKRDRKKMAERSFLYPLATCITLPFEAVFLILNTFGVFVLELTLPMAVTTGLAGLLTGIAFSIDPAVHKAFAAAHTQIRERKLGSGSIKDNMSENTITIPLAQKT